MGSEKATAGADETRGEGDALAKAAVAPEDLPSALRFIHLVEAQTAARVAELSASVAAILETLIGEGQLPLTAYEKRKQLTVLRENERSASDAAVAVSGIADKYALPDGPEIDCDALLPLCKARCCKLHFALSVQDLDERVVRWDYGRPYRIAQGPDGYCVHNEAGGCAVYPQRPGVCRTYDCRSDRRIWIDFEKRIPAPAGPNDAR